MNENTFDILQKYILDKESCREEELLEAWAADVISRNDYSFEKGLLGLGWLIAFLIQYDFMEEDVDEVLGDIDDALYKLTLKELVSVETDVEQILHYVNYYQQRLEHDSKAPFYRRFTHFECMKLLLEKLNAFLLSSMDKPIESTIQEQVHILWKYSYLVQKCVNEKLIEKAFYATMERLITFFEEVDSLEKYTEEFVKLYLSIKQYDNLYWENRLESSLNLIKKDGLNNNFSSMIDIKSFSYTDARNLLHHDKGSKYFIFLCLTNLKISERL